MKTIRKGKTRRAGTRRRRVVRGDRRGRRTRKTAPAADRERAGKNRRPCRFGTGGDDHSAQTSLMTFAAFASRSSGMVRAGMRRTLSFAVRQRTPRSRQADSTSGAGLVVFRPRSRPIPVTRSIPFAPSKAARRIQLLRSAGQRTERTIKLFGCF